MQMIERSGSRPDRRAGGVGCHGLRGAGALGAGERAAGPHIKASLELQGAVDHGGQLFRINCAGCHGLAGQGLVGPQLQGVSNQLKDLVLVHQIISGDTPMPSFEMELQSMADLLAYLHTLS